MDGSIVAMIAAGVHILWVLPVMYFTFMDIRG